MSLETATFINQLDAANPLGSDPIAAGDDHIRLIKATVKATFPNVTGAMTKTHTQLNNTLDKTGDTMTGPLVLSGDPTTALGATTKQYVDAVSTSFAAAIATTNSTVDTKAAKATTITAGTGLTGGGDLSADRTISMPSTGVSAGAYGSSTSSVSLTVDAQGRLTAAAGNTIPLIGVAQTWQNMLSPSVQRASNVSYTNSTGKPIMVAVSASTGNGYLRFYINNVLVGEQGGDYNNSNSFTFIIPNGDSYKAVSGGGGISYWFELR
jgi:hypothetical protein